MDIKKYSGRMDRTRFSLVHNKSVYCQSLFEIIKHEEIRPDTFAYMPCWAVLDPGMMVEAHQHPTPEIYVFTNGEGVMRLGEERFDVENGMAVNIPPNMVHSVTNSTSAIHPLIWVSIGLKE
ncbi:MAG: cupin domain-containing protein [Candidatus Latescibacteria bacterium]|nr:cupin domain-containing protein [Candidatus Latescibacterota bacterium]